MDLIKKFQTDSEGYEVYQCRTSVLIMTSRILDNGHHEHQSGIDVENEMLDDLIEALMKARDAHKSAKAPSL